MNKQKTNKSALKRFKVTKKGKLLHRSQFLRHLRHAKSKSQIRSLKRLKSVEGTVKKKIMRMLARA